MKRYYFWFITTLLCITARQAAAQPCPVTGTTVTNESCAGANNGAATILINSPGSYTYIWQPNVSSTNSAANLPDGNYSVTVSAGGSASGSAVTLFSDNFNSGSSNWTLNTGAGSNQWFVDANYTGSTCYFSGFELFSVPNVPAQPAAVTGYPYSNYLHIRATGSGSGFCDPPWPPLNANFDADQASTQCAEMNLPISTSGYGNVALKFYWLGVGSNNSYGYVQYSTGGGWTSVGGNFSGNAGWQQATVTNAAFDNQPSLRYRFCWTNISGDSAAFDPAFSVDQVSITAQPIVPGCSSVVSFTIQPGAAVNPAFTTLAATYCSNSSDVILIPATSGGTFTGTGVAGNVFAPRNVTTFGTPVTITYSVTQGSCTATSSQTVTVYDTPDAAFTQLNPTYFTTDPPVVLTPVTPGGTFSSACSASNVFIPSLATPGVPCQISYTVTQNGCTATTSQSVLVNTCCATGTAAELRILLQGAYSIPLGAMTTTLRNSNYLPTAQPYNGLPWNYPGSENAPTTDAIPANATDWVLIEARSATDPATLLDRRAGFVLSNGVVVSANGTTGITFGTIPAGSYYLVVRHRNHLPVMSSVPVALPNTGNPYDFTLSAAKTFGTGQTVQLNTNIWAMRAGDVNANGVITFADVNTLIAQILSGNTANNYFLPDVTHDGNVNFADFSALQPNISVIGITPVRY
ncbi:hypothetical protein BVG80_11100 [Sphingobacteriales bacterium TSM_CSM]|nr:hypothetical protein BVG80_11100 [Sphingobacteriales bacterium TSM_CSM]